MNRRVLWLALAAAPVFAQNPMTDAIKGAYGRMKQNLIETAEAMPEGDYGYRLTKEQRPFGDWLEHVAMGNYGYCSAMRGAQPPDAAKSLQALKAKSEIQQALKAS